MRNYNLKLRPHHVKAYLCFVKDEFYNLSNQEYVKRFRLKNGDYHNEKFVIFWRNFLFRLYENQNLHFLYINDWDDVCKSVI